MYQPDQTFRTLRNCILALTLFCFACQKGDKDPAYIEVRAPSLTTQTFPVDEGTSSADITHAWVFVNDQTYGPWELPARVPILDLGDAELKIVAGIERNGSSTDIVQYPFFATDVSNQQLDATSNIIIEPVFEYFDGLEFWHDNFDGGNLFTISPNSDTVFVTSGAMTFEGNNSGAIFLDADHPFFEAQTNADFEVPNNSATFVEMNYASDVTILVGSYITFNNTVTRFPQVFIAPTVQDDGTIPWKKIYLDMSGLWSDAVLTDRELFIAVTKSSAATNVAYVDNIKVVHREL